ncbi:unnamed protein product [Closterium sp. Naga37s-1]|nr:unnamed protein product [Closterium sp. Naga37s-1]
MVYELEPASAWSFAEPASEPPSGQRQQQRHSGVQVRVGPGLVKEATEAADGESEDAGSDPGVPTLDASPSTLPTHQYRTVAAPIHAAPRADIGTQGVSSDGIVEREGSEEGEGSEEIEGSGEGGGIEEREGSEERDGSEEREDAERAERDGSEEGNGSEEEDASGITARAQTVSEAAEETGPVPVAAGAAAGAGAGAGEGAGAGPGAEPERAKKVSVDTLEEARIILKGIDGGEDGARAQMKRVQATAAGVTTQGHGSGSGNGDGAAGGSGGTGEGVGEEGGVDWSHGLKATSMYVVKDGDTCEGLAYQLFRGSPEMMRDLNHGFVCSDATLAPNMQLFVP